MKIQNITIVLPDHESKPKDCVIKALRVGRFFAIHHGARWARNRKNFDGKNYSRVVLERSGWTITHLPTGFAITQGIRKKRAAVIAAQRLTHLKNIPWQVKIPSQFAMHASKLPSDIRAYILASRGSAA